MATVLLLGDPRFTEWFAAWRAGLERLGHTVIEPTTPGVCDAASAATCALVLNVFAHIDPPTLATIAAVQRQKKPVYMLESWGQGIGVSGMHNDGYRRAAQGFGLYPSASPIATFYPHFVGVWESPLLGPGGELRSSLVEALRHAENVAEEASRKRLAVASVTA